MVAISGRRASFALSKFLHRQGERGIEMTSLAWAYFDKNLDKRCSKGVSVVEILYEVFVRNGRCWIVPFKFGPLYGATATEPQWGSVLPDGKCVQRTREISTLSPEPGHNIPIACETVVEQFRAWKAHSKLMLSCTDHLPILV